MVDPKHTPQHVLRATALREAGIPAYGLGSLGEVFTMSPSRHFLRYQHTYGPVPANDPHCPRPTY